MTHLKINLIQYKKFRKLKARKDDVAEELGIDGLWHAIVILQKTLGKVDGYQTDDRIESHKCAIKTIQKIYQSEK